MSQAAGIQSIDIGIGVLKALARSPGPISLTILAKEVGLAPSSCRRYLISLMKSGLVRQEAQSSRYDLGPGLLRLGLQALSRFNVVQYAIDRALLLKEDINQTTLVSVFGENGPTVIAWFNGSPMLVVNSYIGSVYSLLGTATGRVFLAFLPAEAVSSLLRSELMHENYRATYNGEKVRELVLEVRKNMFSSISDEVIPGIGAIAAPVFDAQGSVACAIAVLGPSATVNGEQHSKYVEALKNAAGDVSEAGGFVRLDERRSFSAWLGETWRMDSNTS